MRPATITGARRIAKVRTTAYTHTESGGRRNAVGVRLSGANVMSAASDWSRFPLGTRFQIVGSSDRYVIDDYGGALIGTNTIDLYKTSRSAMRQWGVRHGTQAFSLCGQQACSPLRPEHNGLKTR